MKSEQKQIKIAIDGISRKQGKKDVSMLSDIFTAIFEKEMMLKDALGCSQEMVIAIHNQAFLLYSTGQYKEALKMFRLLVMLNPTEFKYAVGLAACFHMMKEYKNAIQAYGICALLEGDNPIPHYHLADCFTAMEDNRSARVALDMAIERAGKKPQFSPIKDRAMMMIQSLKN